MERLKNRKGQMTGTLIAVIAVAIVMIPVTKWLISMKTGTDDLETRLEMQSIMQDYWNQINEATYDEFQSSVAARGTTWQEEIGDKYTLTMEFSADGKYENASCSVGASVGSNERHCRNVTATIVSKENPALRVALEAARVSMPGESARLAAMESKLAANAARFGNYYTKTESDARYIRKGATS